MADIRKSILKKRSEIYTNQVLMTIGEFMSLYQDDEINITPDFQRLFRWEDYQKSRFIESILLGYPIPAIFIIQREDGVWDVIDGVQRLSTIYQFVGILKEADGSLMKPLKLQKGDLISDLDGYVWNEKINAKCLDKATQIDFKRASLSVIMLKHGSDENSKYELFKRLNTGGSHLSSQEIRNALILMKSEHIFNLIEQYSKIENFISVINISEDKTSLSMDKEIITRYLVARNYDDKKLSITSSSDFNQFLDESIEKVCELPIKKLSVQLEEFLTLINLLFEISEDYGFRIFDDKKGIFKGPFQWFIFETIVWHTLVDNNINTFNKNSLEIYIKSLKGTGKVFKKNIRSSDRFIKSRSYARGN